MRYDLRDAVLAKPLRSVFETQSRALALNILIDSADASDALAAATRIGNILRFARKEGIILPADDPSAALLEDPAEQALLDAFDNAVPLVSGCLERREYADALQALAALRPAVDGFFNAVMVMGDDIAWRDNRLLLLARLHDLFGQFADFERIVTG